MPRGDKSSYTDKQKRQAEHIAEGYLEQGASAAVAKRRAWATVNDQDGGGRKSGSGRGKARKTSVKDPGRGPAARKSAPAKKAAPKRKTTAKKAATKTGTTRSRATKASTSRTSTPRTGASKRATPKRKATKRKTAKRSTAKRTTKR